MLGVNVIEEDPDLKDRADMRAELRRGHPLDHANCLDAGKIRVEIERVDVVAEVRAIHAARRGEEALHAAQQQFIGAHALLDAAPQLAAYAPIDISVSALEAAAASIRRDYPKLLVEPLARDFTRSGEAPAAAKGRRRVGFFPGSTIGNFDPAEAVRLLTAARRLMGDDGLFILGAYLVKETSVMTAAYDDAAGVTAAFNKNLLTRINRELDGDLDIEQFAHVAFYNPDQGRMELYLESRVAQTATIAGTRFEFAAGERIHTENSYKYAIPEFRALAARAGFSAIHTWTDRDDLFSVHYFRQG